MDHPSIQAGAQIEAAAPQLRTLDAMLEDMRTMPPPDPRRPEKVIPIRPTMPAEGPTGEKPLKFNAQAGLQPRAPVIQLGPNIPGATHEGEPAFPHGAIGLNHFVEATVQQISIFPRSNPTLRTRIPLGAFFGHPTWYADEPRVVYDSTWNRWVVTADAFDPADPLFRRWQLLAVSTGSSAFGPYWAYTLNIIPIPGGFYGFVQLGMDQNAIIMTADLYTLAGYQGAEMFAVAKTTLYNGLGFSVPLFTGLRGPLAPPIVLDHNPKTFLISAPAGRGNSLNLYTLTDSGRPGAIKLTGPVAIPVPDYVAPPPAPQPDTSWLDTHDGRFINASTRTGDFLWQVHTINYVGYAAPKFYQINTATNTVVRSNFFYATATSYDFNASIAANSDNDVFVTWSVTDPARGTFVQVRYSGFDHNDGSSYELGPGAVAYTSPTFKYVVEWGYSAVTLDPRNSRRAWLVNEDIVEGHTWGTRIVGIGFGFIP
jgi:hypothetical protein